MPSTKTLTQLVVARIGCDQPHGPRNSFTHPWRRTNRHGVVTVERAPGVARDAATRPATPEEREAQERLKTAVCEAWARGEGSASQIGSRFGATRNRVLGIVHQAGVKRGMTITSRAAPTPAPRPPVHQVRDRHIIQFLAASWTVSEIADFYNLTPDTVRSVRYRARRDGLLPPASTIRTRRSTLTARTCAGPDRVSFLEALPDQCRDLDRDGMCCGRLVVPGRSWCPEHLRAFTQPARRSA